jgi:hypothetical protein
MRKGTLSTLNRLLEDLQRALKKAGNSSGSSLLTREEQEWLVQEVLLQGPLTYEFGFTTYNTKHIPCDSTCCLLAWAPKVRSLGPAPGLNSLPFDTW